ncbi:hypothetical protein QFZ82_002314 [Streptomyces sp. V4I23]|nr:hypothetical protein [Streptomyces sp. V4I23]
MLGAPSVFWHLGGTNPALHELLDDTPGATPSHSAPVNHSPHFALLPEPTNVAGTTALLAAAAHWLRRRGAEGIAETRTAGWKRPRECAPAWTVVTQCHACSCG